MAVTACHISAIIPVHNGAAYLAQTIESVVSNTRAPDDVIVVDDGSTDGTADVARQHPQVRYVYQANQGVAHARHAGVMLATGSLVALLDADDLWTPEKLAVQEAALATHPEWDGVFGQVEQFISPELTNEARATLLVDTQVQVAWLPSALLLRRASYDRSGGFPGPFRLAEFMDWCLRAQDAGCCFGSVEHLVLRRRIHLFNSGRTQVTERQDYARVVKAALERRRAKMQPLN